MKADILSIGDELLIGQTLNTNAQWLSSKLTELGIAVRHVVTISDEASDIVASLEDSLENVDIVLITGGLGPTSDDITRDVLAGYFRSELVEDERIRQSLSEYFDQRGRKMTEEVADLAKVPVKAVTLYNNLGTAPGSLYNERGKIVVSMPGVPYEMKGMMDSDVLPWMRASLDLPVILTRHILTAGRGESQVADKIRHIEENMDDGVKLAYLPDIGKVRLRLTAGGTDEEEVKARLDTVQAAIMKEIGHVVYGFDDDTLEASTGRMLLQLGLTIGTAESCTGGNIARTITSVPGSSSYFLGTIVSYSNEVKQRLLGVSEQDLVDHGAVSEPVVEQMLRGAMRQLKTDLAIAVSGIAGPDGGSEEKPVGTVYIGIGSAKRLWVKRLQFTKRRDINIELTTVVSLVMLRKFLGEEYGTDFS
jgi:nicotinamide-nucleotide amidase